MPCLWMNWFKLIETTPYNANTHISRFLSLRRLFFLSPNAFGTEYTLHTQAQQHIMSIQKTTIHWQAMSNVRLWRRAHTWRYTIHNANSIYIYITNYIWIRIACTYSFVFYAQAHTLSCSLLRSLSRSCSRRSLTMAWRLFRYCFIYIYMLSAQTIWITSIFRYICIQSQPKLRMNIGNAAFEPHIFTNHSHTHDRLRSDVTAVCLLIQRELFERMLSSCARAHAEPGR